MEDPTNVEVKIDNYIEKIKNGYYEASYLHNIIKPVFSSNPSLNYTEIKIEKISFAVRNLLSQGRLYTGLAKYGYKLADFEINFLTKEIEKVVTIEKLDALSPISLTQLMVPINRPFHLLVPRKLYSHLKTNFEWHVQYNDEKERNEIKIASPPASLFCLPKEIYDKMYLIDQFFGQVTYYSTDNSAESRIEIYRQSKGLSIEVSCKISLKVDLDQNSNTSVYLLTEELLESF